MSDKPTLPSAWPGLTRPVKDEAFMAWWERHPVKEFSGISVEDVEAAWLASRNAVEADLAAANARVEQAEKVIKDAARAMHGDGVDDQGQAWDKCLRILDAAIAAKVGKA